MLVYDFRVIGNKLLAVRKRLGMTQMEVAAELGISQVQVSRLEKRILNRLKELI